jgi:hypothetical protein
MMAPSPAPVAVPIAAPFSLVVKGAEQPKEPPRSKRVVIVTNALFIFPPYIQALTFPLPGKRYDDRQFFRTNLNGGCFPLDLHLAFNNHGTGCSLYASMTPSAPAMAALPVPRGERPVTTYPVIMAIAPDIVTLCPKVVTTRP